MGDFFEGFWLRCISSHLAGLLLGLHDLVYLRHCVGLVGAHERIISLLYVNRGQVSKLRLLKRQIEDVARVLRLNLSPWRDIIRVSEILSILNLLQELFVFDGLGLILLTLLLSTCFFILGNISMEVFVELFLHAICTSSKQNLVNSKPFHNLAMDSIYLVL